MKIGLISLSLLCATSLAMAQGAEQKAAEQATTQTQEQTQSQVKKQATRKERPRQGGDIRPCLDRKTNMEIHRCAEKQRKK